MDSLTRLHLLSSQWPPKTPPSLDLTAWKESLSLENIDLLYVIGLLDGSPYLHLTSWLHQDPKRKLIFLEEEGGFISSLLQTAHPCLEDPQVEVEWLSDDTLTAMAEKYPLKRIEVTSFSPQEELRLSLLRKTTLSHALHQDRLHGYQPFENFVRNVPQLKHAFYANALRNSFANLPAIVCGAGPSLSAAIPLLRQLQDKAVIIAGGSSIAALSAAGIEPHFAVAIDPNLEEYRRFKNAFAFECPLLISTRVCPAIFTTTNSPIGYLRSGIGGAPELWLEEELGLLDPLLGTHLGDETIAVTPICAAVAQLFGCSTVLFCGTDLAYTDGQRYAANISQETTSLQEMEKDKNAADRILLRTDKHGQSIATAVRWVMECCSIAHYAKMHPEITWINTTEGGLPIEGIPQLPLKDAVALHCANSLDVRGKVFREIARHPMPDPSNKLKELHASLLRLIAHLEIVVGEKKGSKALAEIELEEELAASVLFYDIDRLFPREEKWRSYLALARRYASVL